MGRLQHDGWKSARLFARPPVLVNGREKYEFCLHFDRSHVERSSRLRTEYERRESNGSKKNHYGGRNCSGDIVNSGIDTVHCRGRIVVCR